MTKRRAVITGIGPITCIGIGREDFWRGMRAEKSGIRSISSFDTAEFNAHCGGEIPDWIPEDYFPPHRLKRLDRYAQFSVASAKMALADAGLPYSTENPQHRVGVSFGTALGGIANAEYQHAHFLKKGTRGVNQTLALQVFGGSAHSNIAIEFGFRGVGTTNSNSCASGTVAVGEALRYIRDDFADVIVAGGAEAPLSPLTFGLLTGHGVFYWTFIKKFPLQFFSNFAYEVESELWGWFSICYESGICKKCDLACASSF